MFASQSTSSFIRYRVTLNIALNILHPHSHPKLPSWVRPSCRVAGKLPTAHGVPEQQHLSHQGKMPITSCAACGGTQSGLRPSTLCDQCPKFGFWSWPPLLLNLYPVNLTGLCGRSHVAAATQQLPGQKERRHGISGRRPPKDAEALIFCLCFAEMNLDMLK